MGIDDHHLANAGFGNLRADRRPDRDQQFGAEGERAGSVDMFVGLADFLASAAPGSRDRQGAAPSVRPACRWRWPRRSRSADAGHAVRSRRSAGRRWWCRARGRRNHRWSVRSNKRASPSPFPLMCFSFITDTARMMAGESINLRACCCLFVCTVGETSIAAVVGRDDAVHGSFDRAAGEYRDVTTGEIG